MLKKGGEGLQRNRNYVEQRRAESKQEARAKNVLGWGWGWAFGRGGAVRGGGRLLRPRVGLDAQAAAAEGCMAI